MAIYIYIYIYGLYRERQFGSDCRVRARIPGKVDDKTYYGSLSTKGATPFTLQVYGADRISLLAAEVIPASCSRSRHPSLLGLFGGIAVSEKGVLAV